MLIGKAVGGFGTAGGGGSFTISPIRLIDSISSFDIPQGDNRKAGVIFTSGGSLKYGDNFAPAYTNDFVLTTPQWHETAPNFSTEFEAAILEIIDEPADSLIHWPDAFSSPVLGQYWSIGSTPHAVMQTLTNDPVNSTRTFEAIFAIRRASDAKAMAQAVIKFTVVKV